MGGSPFNLQQQNIRDAHEEEFYDDDDQFDDMGFSSSSSDDDGSSSTNSSSSDLVEDSTPPTTTTTSSTSLSSSIPNQGPLDEMSSLMHQLPFKRGLSKFYQGKSQSFTSLSNVRSLEDLAKPENPYNKRLKSCRSYGGLYLISSETQNQNQSKVSSSSPPKAISRAIAKKSSASSRGSSCSSLSAKRSHSFLGLNNRPPIVPPQKTTNPTTLCNQQTPLFV